MRPCGLTTPDQRPLTFHSANLGGARTNNLKNYKLLGYTANRKPVVLDDAVRRVDAGAVEVEVAGAGRRVLSRGPVEAVRTLTVEATTPAPAAATLEKPACQ